jgi:hypothetical protein
LRRIDAGIGAFFILFGAFGIFQSLQLPLFQRGGIPGPGMFPLALSITLAAIGVLLIVSRLRAGDGDYPAFDAPSRTELTRVVAAIAAMTVSVLLLPVLGYFLSSLLLVGFLLFGIERLRNWRSLVTTLALPAVFFVIFVILLRVRLPAGIFGS